MANGAFGVSLRKETLYDMQAALEKSSANVFGQQIVVLAQQVLRRVGDWTSKVSNSGLNKDIITRTYLKDI